eukprot:sb/3467728/
MFALGKDRVIPQCFGLLQPRTKIPYNAVMWVGFLGGTLALIFDTSYLIRIANTGYMANCVAANLGILKLRYSFYNFYPTEFQPPRQTPRPAGEAGSNQREGVDRELEKCAADKWLPWKWYKTVTIWTDRAAKACIGLCFVWLFGLVGTLNRWWWSLFNLPHRVYHPIQWTFVTLMIIQVCILAMIPQRHVYHVHKTPWVPWLPMTSNYLVVLLIFEDCPNFVWRVEGYILLISLLVYLTYSYWHMENPPERDDSQQDETGERDELVMTLQTGYHSTQTIAGEGGGG